MPTPNTSCPYGHRSGVAVPPGARGHNVRQAAEHVKVPQASPFTGYAPQLTACFMSAPIRASTSAVTSVRAKPAAHIVPSSRFAWSLKPSVA